MIEYTRPERGGYCSMYGGQLIIPQRNPKWGEVRRTWKRQVFAALQILGFVLLVMYVLTTKAC